MGTNVGIKIKTKLPFSTFRYAYYCIQLIDYMSHNNLQIL